MSVLRIAREADGVVFAEFLISFLPLFLLFLATVQLCLIYAGHLVVQHSAVQAARTAIITLDDDPCFYRGEARGLLPKKARGAKPGPMQRALSAIGLSIGDSKVLQAPQGGLKLQRVRNAAYLPLSVLAPTPSQMATLLPWSTDVLPASLSDQSVASALGTQPSLRVAAGLLAYNRVASAITFPTAPKGVALASPSDEAYGASDLVSVRVTYLFSCNVPLVRELLCESFLDMAGWAGAKRQIEAMRAEPSLENAQKLGQEIFQRLPNKLGETKRSARELLQAEWKWLLPTLASSRNRFVVLRGEATLPNQGAPYPYASELGKVECEGMATDRDAS